MLSKNIRLYREKIIIEVIENGTKVKRTMQQKDLAKKLNVAPSTISMWERNERSPDPDMLIKLSKVLNVSVDKLLGNNYKEEPKEKEEKHQIAFFNGAENLSDADRLAVQNIIDSLNNKNK